MDNWLLCAHDSSQNLGFGGILLFLSSLGPEPSRDRNPWRGKNFAFKEVSWNEDTDNPAWTGRGSHEQAQTCLSLFFSKSSGVVSRSGQGYMMAPIQAPHQAQ